MNLTNVRTTLAALAIAATPPNRRLPGLSVSAGIAPAEVAAVPHTASAPSVDWEAIAVEQNAKGGLHRNDESGLWGRK